MTPLDWMALSEGWAEAHGGGEADVPDLDEVLALKERYRDG